LSVVAALGLLVLRSQDDEPKPVSREIPEALDPALMFLKSYRDLIVWQKSFKLACNVFRATAAFPGDERFGLTAQLRRAAVSIPSNIAEGHGRSTRGEFLNQLSVAHGSANEVQTQFLISQELQFGDHAEAERILTEIVEIQRMQSRMQSRLRKGRD
jgi:four helix bundle protein